MSLSHGILGFLSYGSMTGYDLSKAFDSSVQFFWYAQASHIYLELAKLEQKSFVTCAHIMQMEKPNKKLYSITDAGKKEFLNWLCLESKEHSKRMKNAFLMKVFFCGNQTPQKSICILKSFRADCQAYLLEMQHIPQSIEHYGALVDPYQTIYWQFTADFGDSYMKMCMDWAERCIDTLESIL